MCICAAYPLSGRPAWEAILYQKRHVHTSHCNPSRLTRFKKS